MAATRAWYRNSLAGFLGDDPAGIIGALTESSAADGFDAAQQQVPVWRQQIEILQDQLRRLRAVNPADIDVFFEFNIPRMGRRIDVVLLIESDKPHLVVLEFKQAADFREADKDQVTDYALELKNFHEASHGADIFPVLVATDSDRGLGERFEFAMASDGIAQTTCIGPAAIGDLVSRIVYSPGDMRPEQWEASPYSPTPTIVEAALLLYANHNVNDITRSEGSAREIRATSDRLVDIIAHARQNKRKVIAFVTGVPGAGKTLVGLNIATIKRETDDATHAVFLSGNGPLVNVLHEALARDEIARSGGTKISARTKVKAFIQNVHHFRDEGLRSPEAPIEHVVIFDEAQRAWNLEKTADFMKRRKNLPGFQMSEPEFLISCLDRHDDWAVIICLVGGGQEINSGEAGISAWLEAILGRFSHWDIAISGRLADSEYAAGLAVEQAASRPTGAGNGVTDVLTELHLSVSMRSFRAENLSNFVKALLDIDTETAKSELAALDAAYPIRITRDLAQAKKWIREQARGSERPGMLASSKALRLKPFAIDVSATNNPVHYFLGGKDDARSSYFLEAVASEFDVQGLELDYTLVSWDGDFRMNPTLRGWSYHDFKGYKWQNINNADNRTYLKNAYRVLLTRARQGMVVFVPLGNNPPDATRDPSFYDSTYAYLKSLGIQEIPSTSEDRGY